MGVPCAQFGSQELTTYVAVAVATDPPQDVHVIPVKDSLPSPQVNVRLEGRTTGFELTQSTR